MRIGQRSVARMVAVGLLATVGCRAVRSPVVEPGPTAALTLSPEGAARAQALAFFSKGILDERNRRYEAALSNFQAAAILDPDREELGLRIALLMIQQRRVDEAVRVMEDLYRRHPGSEKVLRWAILVNRAADRTERVKALYRDWIKLTPSAPEPYIELTALLTGEGRFAEATHLLEQAANRVEARTDILALLGGLYAQRAAVAQSAEEASRNRRAAIGALERIRQDVPDDLSVLFQLGDLYIADQSLEKAIECFEQIERRQPNDLSIKKKLALSFRAVGDQEKAIATLEEISKRQPDNPRLYFYLGELYRQQGALDQALSRFSQAAQADPEDPTLVLNMAILQLQDQKDPEAARQTLEQALSHWPGDARLTEMLAYVHYEQHEYARALDCFRQLNERAEKGEIRLVSPTFWFNYALAAQAAGELDEAAQFLNRALGRNPVYLEAYLQHAFQQSEEATIQQSLQVLEKVGQLQPDEPNVYYYLGLLNSYLKAYPAALSAFEKTERLVEDSPLRDAILDAKFYFWYGAAAERNGEWERAEKLLSRCIELDPNHAEAHNYLAYMWAEKGIKLDLALEYVRKALAAKPTSGAFVDTLGWIYFRQGRYELALEELHKAADLLPDDPTILDHLGDVLLQLGDETQAVPYWKRSFILDPENAAVAAKLLKFEVDLEPLRQEAERLKNRKKSDVEQKEQASPDAPPPSDPLPPDRVPDPTEGEPDPH